MRDWNYRVIQEDESGCGIACLAMIAGMSYVKARKIAIDTLGEDVLKGTHRHCLEDIGKHMGLRTGKRYRYFKSYDKLSETCILAVHSKVKEYEGWHWVVYHNGEIYDPSYHHPTGVRYKKSIEPTICEWFPVEVVS